jgi:hypothetical protein
MPIIIRMILSVHLPLLCTETLIPSSHTVLPLGGSEANQMLILLAGSVFLTEVAEFMRHRRSRRVDTRHHSQAKKED